MKIKRGAYISIFLTILILIVLFLTFSNLYTINGITTKAIGAQGIVGVVVEQVCDDTYCNSPETCSTCALDCGTCTPEETGDPSSMRLKSSGAADPPLSFVTTLTTVI